jgi:hypothetical protein
MCSVKRQFHISYGKKDTEVFPVGPKQHEILLGIVRATGKGIGLLYLKSAIPTGIGYDQLHALFIN